MASFTNAFSVHGPVRVAVDQGLIVVGGPDGVVQVYRAARWTAHAQPLWSRKIHDGAVTSIALCSAEGFAFTSGRDGHVYRHDVSATSDALNRSRVVCRVSGEIRVIALSEDRAHLFVAGDSIRYISLGERPYVTSIPSHLPPPLMSLSISPCGGLIAVASSSSADLVISGVPAPSGGQLTQTQPSTADGGLGHGTSAGDGGASASEGAVKKKDASAMFPYAHVKFVLRGVVQKTWRKDEDRAFHTTWCRHTVDSASFLLAIPWEEGVRVLRFLPPDDPANKTGKPVLSNYYTATTESISSISGAWVYPHTNTDFTLALAGQQTTPWATADESHANMDAADGVQSHAVFHVVRCVVKATKGSHTVLSTTRCPSVIVDANADVYHGGHVVVATVAGEVGLLKGVVPHPRKPRSAPDGGRAAAEGSRVPELGAPEPSTKGKTNELQPTTKTTDGAQPPRAKRHDEDAVSMHSSDRGEGSDDASGDGQEDEAETDGSEADSSEGSSRGSSDSESSNEDEGQHSKHKNIKDKMKKKPRDTAARPSDFAGPEEDLSGVVRDLMRSDRHVLRDGAKRRTALRSGTAAGDASGAHQSTGRGRVVPAFLDDEAEEGSTDEEDEEDDDEDYDGGHASDDLPEEEHVDRDEAAEGSDADLEGSRRGSVGGTDRNGAGRGGPRGRRNVGRDGHVTSAQASTPGTPQTDRNYCFQPGATPKQELDGVSAACCYYAYNSIGWIRYHATEGTFVQFHDVSRASIKLNERGTVLMASLGIPGAAFVLDKRGTVAEVGPDGEEAAAAAAAQGQSPLTLYFRTYVALGAQADWRVSLMDGESPRCVAVGLRFVALATNIALRLFSLSGLEMAVLSLPTRIVCMVGCNSSRLSQSLRFDQDPLAVVYHSSGGSGLECVVFNCYSQSLMQGPRPVPVTHDEEYGDHYLEWIGFSDDGPLHTCDSAGVVRMATNDWGGSAWMPVYDPRHFTSDPVYTLWVWGVSDSHLSVYRSARGAAHHYPAATSLPAASAAGMDHVRVCLPLLRVGGEKQVLLRDRFLRSTHKVNELKRTSSHYTAVLAKQDALHDAHVMSQFKEALKEQQTSRAVDLATMFQLRDSVEEAARYANQEGHKAVLLKLVAIIEARHKLKQKRMCSLPLEGSEVTDKERDLILRRLLIKEREAEAAVAAGGGGARGVERPATAPPSSHHPGSTTAASGSVRIPSVLQKNTALDGNTLHLLERTPEEEAAAVAAAAAAPGAQTSKRRSVAFAVDDGPNGVTPAPVTTVTPAAAGPVVVAPPKVIVSAAKAVAPSPVAVPGTVVASKPPPPSFSSVKSAPVAASAMKPSATTAKPAAPFGTVSHGDATGAQANRAPAKPAVLGAAIESTTTSTITPPKQQLQQHQHGLSSENNEPTTVVRKSSTTAQQEVAASGRGVKAAGPSGTTISPAKLPTSTSAPRATGGSSAAMNAVPSSPPLKLAPVAPPSPFDEPAPSFVDLPVDPFLPHGEDGTKVGRRSALLDVGHHTVGLGEEGEESVPVAFSTSSARRDHAAAETHTSFVQSQAVMPKTSSFGDALRKRYRDEEEDDEDDEDSAKPRGFGGDSAPLEISAMFQFQKP